MNLIGDILLKGRTGRPDGALETSPSLSMERAPPGTRYAAAEVLDIDLMDESVDAYPTTKAGEAFVKTPDDWGLLIGLAWSLPAGLVVWCVGFFFL